jgi:hypothetical protein
MKKTLEQMIELLDKFDWWQIKRCKRGGDRVRLVVIQAPSRTDLYWEGQDEEIIPAIEKALAESKKPQSKELKSKKEAKTK